jgi:hypothetical protein
VRKVFIPLSVFRKALRSLRFQKSKNLASFAVKISIAINELAPICQNPKTIFFKSVKPKGLVEKY